MDYIKDFDIRLEKEMYYAGEVLQGNVVLNTTESFKLRAIRVVLRGKAHAEWKVMVSGDRRTVKDDQYFVDDRAVIWGKDIPEGTVPVLVKGLHSFPFRFQLPESSLPCSFESKTGTIRYYIKVTVDMPYASPPQGMKYFTIIGPHLDCMDEQYLKPMCGSDKRSFCCLCCARGPVALRTQLERTAYVCGESIKLKAEIDNQSDQEAALKIKLVQYVEYYLDRGVLGVSKDLQHTVLEYTGDPVAGGGSRWKFDSSQCLLVPVMPPTLLAVCRLMQIYYVLKVNIELNKAGEDLHMHFPITIATVPFRIPNAKLQPNITYSVCCDHVEGGMYIGPEFQLGQVYDGGGNELGTTGCGSGTNSSTTEQPVLLYRPVYVCIPNPMITNTPSAKVKKISASAFDSTLSRSVSRSGFAGLAGATAGTGSHHSVLKKLESSSGLTLSQHPPQNPPLGRLRSNTSGGNISINAVSINSPALHTPASATGSVFSDIVSSGGGFGDFRGGNKGGVGVHGFLQSGGDRGSGASPKMLSSTKKLSSSKKGDRGSAKEDSSHAKLKQRLSRGSSRLSRDSSLSRNSL